MKAITGFLAKYRRLYGLIILAPFFFLAEPTPVTLAAGLPVMLLGLLFRIWSSGYIYKDNRLAAEGPYSIVRNPLYFGSFIMGGGCIAAGGAWILLGVYVITFPIVYISLIVTEEERLLRLFGEEYRDYRGSVPRLLPAIWRYRRTDSEWSFRLTFIEHKEYANVIIAGVLTIFLAVKYLMT